MDVWQLTNVKRQTTVEKRILFMASRYFDALHLALYGHDNDFVFVASIGHHGASCADARPMATTRIQHALWVSHAAQHGVRRGLEPCPGPMFCIDERLDLVDGVVDAVDLVAVGE